MKTSTDMIAGSTLAQRQLAHNHKNNCIDDIEDTLGVIGEKMRDSEESGKDFAVALFDILGDFDLDDGSDNADWWAEFYEQMWEAGQDELLLPIEYYKAVKDAEGGKVAAGLLDSLNSALKGVAGWGEFDD